MKEFDTLDATEPDKPYRKICMSICLTIIGICLFSGGMDLLVNNNDNGIALIVLGILLLIPGCYHVNMAYRAYRGERGYTFDSIPEV